MSLETLPAQAVTDAESLKVLARPVFGGLVNQAVEDTPNYMAESIGPIMGNAIKAQIREDRSSLIEALYPIIGKLVQKASFRGHARASTKY